MTDLIIFRKFRHMQMATRERRIQSSLLYWRDWFQNHCPIHGMRTKTDAIRVVCSTYSKYILLLNCIMMRTAVYTYFLSLFFILFRIPPQLKHSVCIHTESQPTFTTHILDYRLQSVYFSRRYTSLMLVSLLV